MYSPQFLARLRAYLASGGKEDFGGGIRGLTPTTMPVTPVPVAPTLVTPTRTTLPVTAPTERKRDMFDRMMSGMLPPFMQNGQSPKLQGVMDTFTDKVREGFYAKHPELRRSQSAAPAAQSVSAAPASAPAPGTSTPPPGYRYGIDPEFNYGFLPPVKNDTSGETKKKKDGGTISTGNAKADAAIERGDQRVIRNQEAAATYAAMDNARDGSAIPAHLQQRLDARSSGNSAMDRNDYSPSSGVAGAATPGKYRNFWDRINGGGPGAGYTSPLDWINGGGQGGSYANPGTNIRGLGAIVRDYQLGGIGAVARDAVNGRGFGASGDSFRGGERALLLNAVGAKPAGQEGSIFNFIPESTGEAEEFFKTNRPEKDKEAEGTAGTKGTVAGQAAGGIVDSGVPVNFAKGGIADIPDPAAEAQPPMGNEKELISSAIAAIKGQVEDPRPVLGAFLAKYGEEALRNLVDKVQSGEVDETAARSSGMLKGPGDGMDDRIPAKVEGGQDVLLANNEYIVPADVISALGNGSSDAGAQHMDKMLERVRTAAHGKSTQQKKVSADKVLPA